MASEDRELAIERLRVRKEMRSAGDDEDSTVIEQEALSRSPKSSSTPPRAKAVVAILNAVKTPWQAVVMLAGLALLAYFVATAGPAILDRFP
jgi:hypothetical protein